MGEPVSRLSGKKVVVTGGAGFLGRHVCARLIARGVREEDISVPRSAELDLRLAGSCERAVSGADIVIHLAATVGGIGFNKRNPARLFYDNIVMGTRLIEAVRHEGVEKLVVVGTVCSYPKHTPVPFSEDDFWSGYPEETNAPYGIAKKALGVQATAYREQYGLNSIYLVPVNLYGPGDHFDPEDSHVIPALILKFFKAKLEGAPEVVAWGTGGVSREFLYVEDAALGLVLATEQYEGEEIVNLGSGREIMIRDLVEMIRAMVGYEGTVRWDTTQPDGQPRRMLDVTRARERFGFVAQTSFEDGLRKTIDWYRENLL